MLKRLGFIAGLTLIVAACGTAPKTASERQSLESNAQAALDTMIAKDPSLANRLDTAHAYAVFPSVGKAGAIAGGAYGRGVVYQQGNPIGYAELSQASLGLQLGAQTFIELVMFRDQQALDQFKRGGFEVSGAASAVALTAGAAAGTEFGDQGTAIFILPRGGLMAELSVAGQEINFQAKPL